MLFLALMKFDYFLFLTLVEVYISLGVVCNICCSFVLVTSSILDYLIVLIYCALSSSFIISSACLIVVAFVSDIVVTNYCILQIYKKSAYGKCFEQIIYSLVWLKTIQNLYNRLAYLFIHNGKERKILARFRIKAIKFQIPFFLVCNSYPNNLLLS